MNTSTGEIKYLDQIQKEGFKKYISINADQMNAKQKQNMQVSKHDNRSKLGRLFTIMRRHPKIGRNQTCPCGSGIKFKKCHGRAV